MPPPSERIRAAVAALPIEPGIRVLEIGCGPGSAAREVARRLRPHGFLLGIDRSSKAIALARKSCSEEMEGGWLDFRQASIEDFCLQNGEARFDLAFALRVGALDGRHPQAGARAYEVLREVLKPGAPLLIDGGDPLRSIDLDA